MLQNAHAACGRRARRWRWLHRFEHVVPRQSGAVIIGWPQHLHVILRVASIAHRDHFAPVSAEGALVIDFGDNACGHHEPDGVRFEPLPTSRAMISLFRVAQVHVSLRLRDRFGLDAINFP
jgi:hypothetical protein